MKNMDLYKAIIFASILLIPAAGFFAYWQTEQLDIATKAVREAKKRNGLIEKIGVLKKELESIAKNKKLNQNVSHDIYFEKQISIAAGGKGSNFKSTNLKIGNEESVGAGKHAQDFEVKIDFVDGGKPLQLPRDFIHAVLFNCEAFVKTWRLREVSMVNVDCKGRKGTNPPPKTVGDKWEVKRLKFARRVPKRKEKKRS